MTESRITASRIFDAPADVIFRVLSNPERHALNKLLAWKTADSGEHPAGWEWVWELEESLDTLAAAVSRA